METRSDVVLVSIFGRGNWLAAELAHLGLEVALIDISDQFGHWAPEDWEGPFGLLQSEGLSQSMMTRLHEEDYFDAVDEGAVVWTRSGPLDVQGPHASYLLEKFGITVEQQNYLQRFDSIPRKDLDKIKKNFKQLRFKDNWFLQLAHSLASTTQYSNNESLDSPRPLPIFSPLSIRRVSRKGYDRALSYIEGKKVNVIKKARLRDVSVVGRKAQSVEVESAQWSGVLTADQFVWALSSAETAHVSKNFVQSLYGGQVSEPSWAWVRYRLEVLDSDLLSVVPKKFVMIEDMDLNWTHSNMTLVQKTVNEKELDFWIKVPTAHRFHRDYLEKMGSELLTHIQSRLPNSTARLVSLPQECHYDSAVLGPPRFPVYEPAQVRKFATSNLNNLDFDSPERWELLDWTGQHLYQKGIFENLKSWKTERDQKRAKLEAQAAARKG
jgi:hypothetical protein